MASGGRANRGRWAAAVLPVGDRLSEAANNLVWELSKPILHRDTGAVVATVHPAT